MKTLAKIFFLTLLIQLSGCDYLPTKKNEAEKSIKNMLVDPNSAIFKDVKVGTNSNYVCGFVNSKNRMGGYAGEAPFIYDSEKKSAQMLTNWANDRMFRDFEFSLRYKNSSETLKLMGQIETACKFPTQWTENCGGLLIHNNDTELCPLYVKAFDGGESSQADTKTFYTKLLKRFQR